MTPQTDSTGPGSVPSGSPAVVYFAKVPRPGLVKTRLVPPLTEVEAAGLYSGFVSEIVVPVPGVRTLLYGWPGEALTELADLVPDPIELRPQCGAGLFERMVACFAELFAEGHGTVLIRNTDSPDLPPERVAEALARCRRGNVVLGPDTGGGYYLVALAAPCPGLFRQLDEGADTVFDATVRCAGELGLQVETLPRERDVDSFDDLVALWRARLG